MARRVLFVIRGKLGDTLVAFATVRTYADAFPEDDVTLLTRAGYADLLRGEERVRVIGFKSSVDMFLLLLRLAFEPAFDALLVLWGFGTPVKRIGRMVRARRKVYLDGRYASVFPEFADLSPHRLQSEPMWLVAKRFEPNLPQPLRLDIPSLAARRVARPKAIGIAPLADEPRRIMSPPMLASLLGAIARSHPGAAVRVFLNPPDRGSFELISAGLPPFAEFFFFPRLDDLVRGFGQLSRLYCTDTGLYHLAAAMGIPATVFYGPTQPWKNMMPAQSASQGIRLRVLGKDHCEEKTCESPVCIDGAIRAFGGEPPPSSLRTTPPGCPLRRHCLESLAETYWHEDPGH